MAQNVFKSRIFRCGESDYYGDEILLANKIHTPKRLRAISAAGFNGIWLHAQLRDLEPGELFAGYSANVKERIAELKKLTVRARKYGLKVWLYFTEPLGLNILDPFWKQHPEVKGHFHPRNYPGMIDPPGAYALCSSTMEVKKYLRQGFFKLFKKTPLAGVILITSSEHDNNCWSNVAEQNNECNCQRCAPRGPAPVISEVINLINDGIKAARPEAEVVAWNWDWSNHLRPPYREIVERLPETVTVMGDFERGGTISRLRKKRFVNEYSMFYPGPSPHFVRQANFLSEKRPVWAKLQINTTHELATVPSMPLVISLYRKFKYLRDTGVSGYMACWNFGCAADTLNVMAVRMLSHGESFPGEMQFLKMLACEFFGAGIDMEKVVRAWYGFYHAGLAYPLNGFRFLYYSPMNFSMVYPLKLSFKGTPMPPNWTKEFKPFGDRLEDTLDGYSLEETILLLGKLSTRWAQATKHYIEATKDAANRKNMLMEVETAIIISCCFRSVYNTYRWYASRKDKTNAQSVSLTELNILKDELSTLERALPIMEKSSRFGIHEEKHLTMFDAEHIKEKMANVKKLIALHPDRRQRDQFECEQKI